ncbi:uncharacterized protein [Euwallacea fornicatus]|uniref:uncharacterized protein isoform X1 n=1 Tax=Euwallacea fornicatus TaxID=995702 RepID=UPI00338FD42F
MAFWKTFDFGVPLEDVSPAEDMHMRLKHLFHMAYKSYIKYEYSIEGLLKYNQGSLNERLELKDRLVFALDYHAATKDFSPGAYFWLLRHFLGLLPIPLLPAYTGGINFEWKSVANECKKYFNCYNSYEQKRNLEYNIAQKIGMLPMQNLTFLNAFIQLLRVISFKKTKRSNQYQFNRKSLKALVNYYCPSLFIRPYQPQSFEKCKYFPLILLIILRWKNIYQHCCGIHMHRVDLFSSGIEQQGNKLPQTHYHSHLSSNFYKEVSCQTEIDLYETSSSYSDKLDLDYLARKQKTEEYKLAYIEKIHRDSTDSENEDNNASLFQTTAEFNFTDLLENEEGKNWESVIKETNNVVRKMEDSYIYDDYETFEKEDFNQIAENRSFSSLFLKLSKRAIHHLPKSSPKQEVSKSNTSKKPASEGGNSYVKYPDVCCESCNKTMSATNVHDSNLDFGKLNVNDCIKRPGVSFSADRQLFHNGTSVDILDDPNSSKEKLHKNGEKKNKTWRCIINMLAISFEFLKTLTPKHSSFKRIKTMKYRRIGKRSSHAI